MSTAEALLSVCMFLSMWWRRVWEEKKVGLLLYACIPSCLALKPGKGSLALNKRVFILSGQIYFHRFKIVMAVRKASWKNYWV